MDRRPNLQELLESIIKNRNVYLQPPPSIQIKYPAIIYSHSDLDTLYANNKPYLHNEKYEIIVIDYDPESEISRKIRDLPLCKFNRHYTANNLNHDVFTLYY